jgi:hypothetical protein
VFSRTTTKSQSGRRGPGRPGERDGDSRRGPARSAGGAGDPARGARWGHRSSPPEDRPPRAGWPRSPGAGPGWRRAGPPRCAGSGRPRGRSRSCRAGTPAAATTFRASATTSGPIPSPPITATRWLVDVVLTGSSALSVPDGLRHPGRTFSLQLSARRLPRCRRRSGPVPGPGPENEKPPTKWTVGRAHTGGVCAYSIMMTAETTGMDIARTQSPAR